LRRFFDAIRAGDRFAEILIAHGAAAELEHAASLAWIDKVRQFVEHDSHSLSRPRSVKPPIGGAAMLESPLRAAMRRRYTQLVAYLVEHGAV
jgi:hypothetical protein